MSLSMGSYNAMTEVWQFNRTSSCGLRTEYSLRSHWEAPNSAFYALSLSARIRDFLTSISDPLSLFSPSPSPLPITSASPYCHHLCLSHLPRFRCPRHRPSAVSSLISLNRRRITMRPPRGLRFRGYFQPRHFQFTRSIN